MLLIKKIFLFQNEQEPQGGAEPESPVLQTLNTFEGLSNRLFKGFAFPSGCSFQGLLNGMRLACQLSLAVASWNAKVPRVESKRGKSR